jgi:outer membrane protein
MMFKQKSGSKLGVEQGFAVVACFLMLVTSGAAQAEDIKVGMVDMQRAIQSVEAGKKAKSTLEKDFNTRKKELQTEEASIKKMGDELRKQSLALNDEARARKQAELQERIMKFQELTARSQQEIAQKEQELTQPIVAGLRKAISEIAKQKGYTLILEKNENTVLFSLEKDDLTQEIITSFNKVGKG